MLYLHDVDFYIWLRRTSPKEGNKFFKTQFWKLFQLNNLFKISTNNMFHQEGSVNGCLWLSAWKKCPPLDANLEQLALMQWLWDNAGLTTQLVEEVIKPYATQCTQNLLLDTTWNEPAKWAEEKCKPHASTTRTIVVPHLEQAPTLLQQVTENKALDQNYDMIIDDPVPDISGSSTHLDSIPDNTAALPYNDKLELST